MPQFKIFPMVLAALMLVVSSLAQAAATPHQLMAERIQRITERIDAERERIKADENYAAEVVNEELEGLVDFRRITQLVMGRYFKDSSAEQKRRFLAVFRQSLVSTYSSGLTLYEGQAVQVIPAQPDDIANGRARVRSEITTGSGRIVPINFTLYQTRDGQWLVENVIVNGLNLGRTFRTQFEQSVAQHQGDLDQVISGWTVGVDVENASGEETD